MFHSLPSMSAFGIAETFQRDVVLGICGSRYRRRSRADFGNGRTRLAYPRLRAGMGIIWHFSHFAIRGADEMPVTDLASRRLTFPRKRSCSQPTPSRPRSLSASSISNGWKLPPPTGSPQRSLTQPALTTCPMPPTPSRLFRGSSSRGSMLRLVLAQIFGLSLTSRVGRLHADRHLPTIPCFSPKDTCAARSSLLQRTHRPRGLLFQIPYDVYASRARGNDNRLGGPPAALCETGILPAIASPATAVWD
ncbi:hypothetical protein C8J57DRAFT_202732 [Mycena rebaudengoi]|nr:hypothetical protein C8J57DRAFT_202732 [Mycena rebaudengoi]